MSAPSELSAETERVEELEQGIREALVVLEVGAVSTAIEILQFVLGEGA